MAELKKREDIEEKFKWDTSSLYKDDEAWEKEFEELAKDKDFLNNYKGKLDDKKILLEALKKNDDYMQKIERLIIYAHMKKDEDTSNSKYQSMYNKIENLYMNFSASSSFFLPELTKKSEKELKIISELPEFADYDYYFKTLIRQKKYILSEKEEKILALSAETASGYHNAFEVFDNVELPLPKIKNEKGESEKLSHARYSSFLMGKNREVRRAAFKGMFNAYKKMLNTVTAIYTGNVKKDVFYTRARGNKSCLNKALYNEDVEESVYSNLLDAVNKGLPVLHRYMAWRKKELHLDKLHMYDLHTPVCEDYKLELPYNEACSLVKEALSVLGNDYVKLLDKAFNEKWIDVYENKGKRSGAYSTSAYLAHPYVLLNYEKTTHDVFTIAHELGHAMHSYYSAKYQPYAKADYTIFVAEVASTVNEVLLLKYLLEKENSKKAKKFFLTYFLDMFRTTLFRQTMFAEFELEAHTMQENGVPLTKENLCKYYYGLNKKYYGKDVFHDKEIQYEWARIPHFYTAFYVYKYATGLTSAVTIAEKILKDEKAVENYKKFLSSGSMTSPVELLKIAGADLSKVETFDNAIKVFEDTFTELQNL